MTNAIGTGTCNLSLNLPRDERAELGRLAFRAGARSVGDYVRRLMLSGLERDDLESARRIKEIRQRYYGAALLALFIGLLLTGEANDLRRARRSVRERRTEERA